MGKASPIVVEIKSHPTHVIEFFRCVVHTIIFHRALGNVRVQDYVIERLDNFTYARCNDVTIDTDVERMIEGLRTKIINTSNTKFTVNVEFREQCVNAGWLGTSLIPGDIWETWSIQITLEQSDELKKNAEEPLRKITTKSAICYPFVASEPPTPWYSSPRISV